MANMSRSGQNTSVKDMPDPLQSDSGCFSGTNVSLFSHSGGHSSHLDSRDHHSDGDIDKDKGCYSTTIDSGIDISEQMSSLNLTAGKSEVSHPSDKNELSNSSTINPESGKRLQLTPVPDSSSIDNEKSQAPRSPLSQLGLSTAFINLLKEIFRSDDDGDTQLHYAVMEGFVEAVWHITRLIPHQALLDLPNNSGRTALHLAVASGDTKVARHLIICGASPVARDNTGSTPLHVACRSGNIAMVTELTQRVKVAEVVYAKLMYPPAHIDGPLAADLTDYDGQTCIHLAAQGGHMDILQHLTWFGADINAKDGKCGRTSLHYAVELRDPNLVTFLLGSCRAALNVTSYAGLTPYQLAVANDAPAIASLLVELGASSEAAPTTQDEPEEVDLEELSNNYAESGGSWVDDLRLNAISMAAAIPVTTAGPLNMDLYM